MAHSPPQSGSLVRLIPRDKRLLVDVSGHAQVALPKVPWTQVQWMLGAIRRLWQSNVRCLAFGLLFSPEQNQWMIHLPRQTCHMDRSCFSAVDMIDTPPGFLLAGSFQATADRPWQLDEIVPDFDGLHFFVCAGTGEPRLSLAVRCDKQLFLGISPDHWIFDDRALLLERSQARMACL